MDLTVEGRVFIRDGFKKCCLGIKNGRIVEIKKILRADKHFDFGNKLILPAGVDLHVHFREPGLTYKEDFSSGSEAAAFGGISCVFDMPNTRPPTTSSVALSEKIDAVSDKSFVDFGLYMGVTQGNIESLVETADKCSGFKIYLGGTQEGLGFNIENLRLVLTKIGSTKKPLLVHAEDKNCLLKNEMFEKDLVDHSRSHPVKCEKVAIEEILKEAKDFLETKIHICHVSSGEGLRVLKKRHGNISCGVTPHHCLLNVETDVKPCSLLKVNPPLRTFSDMKSLFNAARDGLIDVLESDHAPHTLEEKNRGFNEAPAGLPSVEVMYPLFLFLAKKNLISFRKLVSLLCEKPSDIMNVPKGRIEVGRDADFIVVNPEAEKKVKSDDLHSKSRWTPFEGFPVVFPEVLFIRGNKVVDNGELVVNRGFGRFIDEASLR